jgi:predicted transcriptional regulator of viral defense system
MDILAIVCLTIPMTVQEELRRRIDREVFDYRQVTDCLRDYAKPRDKIGSLLASGFLVRVRKGLYVFGETWRRQPVAREALANLIYGPSYISLEYALGYYGLIPERVETVTSVTTGKARRFQTPFGLFTYRSLSTVRYAVGMTLTESGSGSFFIATPEKALADFVWADRRFRPAGAADFADYLHDDLRIESARLAALDRDRLDRIAKQYGTPKIARLATYVRQLRRRRS